MSTQTLKQAIHLATSGKSKSKSLAMAASILSGCPEGAWGETRQAKQQMLELLPHRQDRDYTIEEWIEAAYRVVGETARAAGHYESAL